MTDSEQPQNDADVQKKVTRTQLILYIVMFLGMLLPFLVAWMTGAFRVQ